MCENKSERDFVNETTRQHVIVNNLLFDSQHGFACDKDEIDQRDFFYKLKLLFLANEFIEREMKAKSEKNKK